MAKKKKEKTVPFGVLVIFVACAAISLTASILSLDMARETHRKFVRYEERCECLDSYSIIYKDNMLDECLKKPALKDDDFDFDACWMREYSYMANYWKSHEKLTEYKERMLGYLHNRDYCHLIFDGDDYGTRIENRCIKKECTLVKVINQ